MNGGTVLDNFKELAYNSACCRCQYYINEECSNKDKCCWKIIEKELKRLEEYDKTEYSALIESHKKLLKEKKVNEKKLKAMQIIRTHFRTANNINENALTLTKPLTQEEYDLLKEVLL